jgi:hypothetical protein
MRAILVGGLALIMMSVGGGPALAVPVAPARPEAGISSPFLLVIRHHHRHHRGHWRNWHSRGSDYGAPEAYPPGIEGQSVPAPPYPDPGAGSAPAPPGRSAGASASRPSIRWVDPDRSSR